MAVAYVELERLGLLSNGVALKIFFREVECGFPQVLRESMSFYVYKTRLGESLSYF